MKNLFRSLQDQLTANLRGARAVLSHPGARGEASEANWITMLEAHLPRRYSVDKTFVVDFKGECSDEIDIVIYDRQYTPILYNHSRQLFIPSESVYAVLEVKQNLNRPNLEYAGLKAASVRKLERTSAEIPHAGGMHAPRPLPHLLAGIIAYESDWSPVFGESLKDVLGGRTEAERLDLGCAVLSGSFDVNYQADGSVEVTHTDSSTALMAFFLNLLKRLQTVGTVPAIDYNKYLTGL